jgi:hypothetical protein
MEAEKDDDRARNPGEEESIRCEPLPDVRGRRAHGDEDDGKAEDEEQAVAKPARRARGVSGSSSTGFFSSASEAPETNEM